MDVLAPISMKNAARMRYAMWIAEPRIIGYLNATGASQLAYLFQCAQTTNHNLNVGEYSPMKYMLFAAVTIICELLSWLNTLYAPDIK